MKIKQNESTTSFTFLLQKIKLLLLCFTLLPTSYRYELTYMRNILELGTFNHM